MKKPSKKDNKIRIGTSGWMYKDWGEIFYPKDMTRGHLAYLAQEFDTVEVNTSFYHLPTLATFKKWRIETPLDFVFSVKLSRYITHEKKLQKIKAPFRRFFNNAKGLGEKLGVILIQLPPFLKFDKDVLKKFIQDIKTVAGRSFKNHRFAIEPRHASWIAEREKVLKLLAKEKIALVFPHSSKIPSFEPHDKNITADFIYIRFHGPTELVTSRYGAKRLSPWAKKIKNWHKKGFDVFVYFNNDIHGHAIHDARTNKKLVGLS